MKTCREVYVVVSNFNSKTIRGMNFGKKYKNCSITSFYHSFKPNTSNESNTENCSVYIAIVRLCYTCANDSFKLMQA